MKRCIASVIFGFVLVFMFPKISGAAYHFSTFKARHPIHIYKISGGFPQGITPTIIKNVYHLPQSGGHGVVAIIGAYNDATIEKDLESFDLAFNLAKCTISNGCLEIHKFGSKINSSSGWNLETSLDVEWAHAIAPNAKILLVEATTPSGANLLQAVDYTAGRGDVTAISMSWGGGEFTEEKSLDSHFVSKSGATFFASSGDNGWGASWPATSPNVVAVGGTSLYVKSDGTLVDETAWSGSGGGVSRYETQPDFQSSYSIPKSKNMRAIPDVAYSADPKSGFSVYSKGKWYVIGGTSAGAPQWAAIQSLGMSANNQNFYSDKSKDNFNSYFKDIVSGANGKCVYYCEARKHYDYITGLGSPVTVNF
ncbi:MAG TPA: S53 family peptidase [Candidatus Saccharimonadales bacterium]|jgi:subtilase family serine protease|nr:S53 family peptidase [Candidatus Saccharimonadales bacterium]